jgi:hypothetical protein
MHSLTGQTLPNCMLVARETTAVATTPGAVWRPDQCSVLFELYPEPHVRLHFLRHVQLHIRLCSTTYRIEPDAASLPLERHARCSSC